MTLAVDWDVMNQTKPKQVKAKNLSVIIPHLVYMFNLLLDMLTEIKLVGLEQDWL